MAEITAKLWSLYQKHANLLRQEREARLCEKSHIL